MACRRHDWLSVSGLRLAAATALNIATANVDVTLSTFSSFENVKVSNNNNVGFIFSYISGLEVEN